MPLSFIKIETEDSDTSASGIEASSPNKQHSIAPYNSEINNDTTSTELYNDADVLKFFSERIPATVSEACLVNDHFILVKMHTPTITCWQCKTKKLHEVEADVIEAIGEHDESARRRKFRNFFNCKRCRRIAPQLEPQSEYKGHLKSEQQARAIIWSIESNDTSTGSIKNNMEKTEVELNSSAQSNESVASQQQLEEIIAENVPTVATTPTSPKSAFSIKGYAKETTKTVTENPLKRDKANHSAEAQEDSSSPLKLECYTSIGETTRNGQETSAAQETAAAQSGQINSLWRLWKTLRGRSNKELLSKRKAMVCKTYFIRWTKPPETRWHGYGIARNAQQSNSTPVRRCRSAIF